MAGLSLRPFAGFTLQTESAGTPGMSGKWYLNMCSHKLVDMPIAYSGKPADKEYILARGIGNMQVPFDMGTFRKLKERAEGSKKSTYCVDVIFNPLIVQLFMDDAFCKAMEQFRPFVINLVLSRVEASIGVRLATDKIKLVKDLRYKDGEGPNLDIPRELADLESDRDNPLIVEQPPKQTPEESPEPLIEDVTPAGRKPKIIKKGFFNNPGKKSLYGPEGSKEGVVPENAGDPMGWMPKKLRQTSKIIDCNSPEYQQNLKAQESANSQNKMNQEFRDTIMADLDKYQAKTYSRWEDDRPEGTEKGIKYDNDYSRFDKIPDVDEAAEKRAAEREIGRDWYCNEKGETISIDSAKKINSAESGAAAVRQGAAEVLAAAEAAGGTLKEAATSMKKGFLDSSKTPLYPKEGSEQLAPAKDDDVELMKQFSKLLAENQGAPPPSLARPTTVVKVPERKAPDFKLSEVPEGLQLTVTVPGLTSMKEVTLDVTDTAASLAFPSDVGLNPLQVELPTSVLPTGCRAKFSKKTQQITVSLPVANRAG
eukprot:gnl/TRDRNA2_/TRDRNA2_180023_c0_seq1.p1 gnl/TRDRNA2_/TRDRNA2_180023_c0~~gnl/TRDRNA2_/TRDRNA2_180023_c0_seq1.p1  ORF type:complete len:538 (-),score=128.77 gnl/TRDRNA2_/TRDRNA2_180023_c0_seq1:52-1665(-)